MGAGRVSRCLSLLFISLFVHVICAQDLPCAVRDVGIEGRSILCVCNATYCDTITRESPSPSTYVVYTTSKSGLRFEKSYGVILPETEANILLESQLSSEEDKYRDEKDDFDVEALLKEVEEAVYSGKLNEFKEKYRALEEDENLRNVPDTKEVINVVFRIYTNTRHQWIQGFGGAVTDAATINWRSVSDPVQTHLINSYFAEDGLEYNLIRVPIAGCDFSTYPYTYNEEPWYDHTLTNYSMTHEDLFFKLAMIKRSQEVATDEVKIMASTWSPPVWMKTNERITGFAQLKKEYYQAYADYHLRFFEEYAMANVKIWSITTTNEPINGIVPVVNFNSLGWWPGDLGRWVHDNLGPTIRNSSFNDTLILAGDDQRYLVPFWMAGMVRAEPGCLDYIDGLAWHYYGNFIPPQILTYMHRKYPNMMMISSEACEGPLPWDAMKVEIGSWRRAARYIKYIIQDLNNFVAGWLDWNLCLDPNGGPNWADNFVDAPILVYAEEDEFVKQPMFYAMGHFSKFIPRDSRRIQMSRRSLSTVGNVAFLNPSGNIVVVLHNTKTEEVNVRVRISSSRYIEVTMEPESVKTIEINQN